MKLQNIFFISNTTSMLNALVVVPLLKTRQAKNVMITVAGFLL